MSDVTVLDVLLYGEPIGTLTRVAGDRTLFAFNEAYIANADRPTLGLRFKDQHGNLITDFKTVQTKVMPYFSNLLPEGPLRTYLAERAGVRPDREFFLLWVLGRDLPGAITVRPADGEAWPDDANTGQQPQQQVKDNALRFSLAGVQLKFSAAKDARGGLTIPVAGSGGAYIVKLPSQTYRHVPENEFSMMTLANHIGIDVPPIDLVDVAAISNLPQGIEALGPKAFVIERFDRLPDGGLIHIEDFAQVFDVYPDDKYKKANMRSIARVVAAESDDDDLAELVRRMTFNTLIGNGDMHLKNWSLVYPDRKNAALAPAYDFVSTIPYIPNDSAALNVSRSKSFADFSADELAHFSAKAALPEKLVLDTARETVARFREVWEQEKNHLPMHGEVTAAIDAHISRVPIANERRGEAVSNINIKRVVENIRSGTNIYTPVVELIVNGIQAVRAARNTGGSVTVTILRSAQQELGGGIPDVDGFSVKDDGIGFTAENRKSFDTLYSDWKDRDGGKGFGRFTCLKYFNKLAVDSVFTEDDALKRRSFQMGKEAEIIVGEKVSDAIGDKQGSVVTISGIKAVKFPEKGLDVIARVLVERLLPYFIDRTFNCPRIIVVDSADGTQRVLNDYLTDVDRQIIELPVSQPTINFDALGVTERFNVRIFKIYAAKSAKSKVSLVAHRREVTETTLQTYIPEFASEFYDKADEGASGRDRNYIIKAYVQGDYLDRNVSLERGTFNFDADTDLILGISRSQIEEAAAAIAQEAVGGQISERQQKKAERIQGYVEEKAPWHRTLSAQVDFSKLPMNPSDEDIELHLQASKFQMEVKARAAVRDVLADPDPKALDAQAGRIVHLISETNKNDLIHYVSLRKCVIDLFAKALEKDESGKYKSEGAVHDIIIPRKTDTDELDYAQHNLWMLDERLTFASYASSEKPLKGKKGDRTDLTVFNRPVAFRGDNEPSNPIIVFEFKRPGRDDFANPSSKEDPIEQVKRYVNQIRDGKYQLPGGRPIRVADNTPFYGYVVCDFSSKVTEWLFRTKNFTPMPDGLGYFEWFPNIKLYIEVLSWDKVLADATMRNKIFFQKLGI